MRVARRLITPLLWLGAKIHVTGATRLAGRLPSASVNENVRSIWYGNPGEQLLNCCVPLSPEITGREIGKLNVAVTCRFALMTTVQGDVPWQLPPQPAKLDGVPGVG